MTVDRPFEGNQAKTLPGTCERCVWGRGKHANDCESFEAQIDNHPEWHQANVFGTPRAVALLERLMRDYDPLFRSRRPNRNS
jgi:hypothetical protein